MTSFTPVELAAISESTAHGGPFLDERIGTVVVDNFPALGRLTALRFLEWVGQNPEGVVSLPTGKTPEHFIKWVTKLVTDWEKPTTIPLLEKQGLDPARKPSLNGLRFVQIDDFYPIESTQENSFFHYVNRFYLTDFGMDPARALLMDTSRIGVPPGKRLVDIWPDMTVDLSLRHRAPRTALEELQRDALTRVDQWCQEYEGKINELGGIGFFLGGIGPDGHVGFNVRGSDHYSTTRLTPTNYETQAAAATDLGGIEISRSRLVITIGLGTITKRKDCVALIMAAGEAKAKVVADALASPPDVNYPASALQKLPMARFYITSGAAKLLVSRRHAELMAMPELPEGTRERMVIDLALKLKKRLIDLSEDDFSSDAEVAPLLKHMPVSKAVDYAGVVRDRMADRMAAGARVRQNTRFLHTEPHHDDVMLGYLPAIVRNMRGSSNTHYFAALTSGFTSVTNDFLRIRLERTLKFLTSKNGRSLLESGYFRANDQLRNRDVWQYLDGIAADDRGMRREGSCRRLLRDLVELTGSIDPGVLEQDIRQHLAYLSSAYPGQKDPPRIQRLKGMRREWEVECLWGFLGWSTTYIRHLRLGFYTGDIFTEEPTMQRDVPPILSLMDEARPDIVTVALDPEASGPDTHYKALQAVVAAVNKYVEADNPQPKIWGYRNVWYRFHPSEANMWVPVSLNMFATMEKAFMETFLSQREASFPSWECDGPFHLLAQKIQVEQYQMAKVLLGREWFQEHSSPLIRATRGLVFLKEMDLPTFQNQARELRRATENREE